MVNYDIKLSTSDGAQSGTKGESEQVELSGALASSNSGKNAFIGDLALTEMVNQMFMMKEDNSVPPIMEIKFPDGKTYSFPIYSWIPDNEEHHFEVEEALKDFDEHCLGNYSRKQEVYCWAVFKEGLPHCMKVGKSGCLPYEDQFSNIKNLHMLYDLAKSLFHSRRLYKCYRQWISMDEIFAKFTHGTTKVLKYIHEHWKEDEFFGYQFLNGINPMMIQRCSELPSNFPVTDRMVFPCGQYSLADEMKNGNIFLCDYKILEGVETSTINGKKQYLMAPLVLLQKTPDDKMMPIAIQLKQEPAEDNPIFFPTDSEYDWLLAKIFVRSADFNVHQLNFHLLRTHLLGEVFAVSLLRNVPTNHPLYKLLLPYTRYNLQIDFLARWKLISVDGVFTMFAASGGEGMLTILRRSLSSLTYSSLCIHEDITERGLEDVPNFYYREDGLELWNIIHRFVTGIINYYYKNDDEVQKDTELQKWIGDIFEHGFLSQESTGIPQGFTTVVELIKFVTMVIFTGSVQHAAVNSGQFDFGGWMPNSPLTLQLPPPTKKGEATEATILATFPDVNATAHVVDTLYLLSDQSSDFVSLGQYPEDHFTGKIPLKLLQDFQGELEEQQKITEARNSKLELPYKYLEPTLIENSVTI